MTSHDFNFSSADSFSTPHEINIQERRFERNREEERLERLKKRVEAATAGSDGIHLRELLAS